MYNDVPPNLEVGRDPGSSSNKNEIYDMVSTYVNRKII